MTKRALIVRTAFLLIFCIVAGNVFASKKAEVMAKSKMSVAKGTLIVTAKGRARPDTTEVNKQRYEARVAAVMVTQYEMAKKLKDRTVYEEKELSCKYDKKNVCTLVTFVRFR